MYDSCFDRPRRREQGLGPVPLQPKVPQTRLPQSRQLDRPAGGPSSSSSISLGQKEESKSFAGESWAGSGRIIPYRRGAGGPQEGRVKPDKGLPRHRHNHCSAFSRKRQSRRAFISYI